MHSTVGRPGKVILQIMDTYLAQANLNAHYSWQAGICYVWTYGLRRCIFRQDIKRPRSHSKPIAMIEALILFTERQMLVEQG